jgi:hypothetical protein
VAVLDGEVEEDDDSIVVTLEGEDGKGDTFVAAEDADDGVNVASDNGLDDASPEETISIVQSEYLGFARLFRPARIQVSGVICTGLHCDN